MSKELDRRVVADRMHSASIHLLRRLRKVDVAAGHSPARLSALSVLVFGGPRTLGELAANEQVKPPTMSQIVRGMETAGLVRRRRVANDARAVRLEATARGRQILQRGRARRIELLADLMKGLTNESVGRLGDAAALMEQIVRTPG